MKNTKTLLNQLLVGDMSFEDFIDMELQVAQSMQINRYSKPILHEEPPLSVICMNLYQAIKAENKRHSSRIKTSNYENSPLCKYWLNKANTAIDNAS